MLRKSRYYYLLGAIIVAGAILRFYDLGSVSMTADELSALERLHFSSFSEMIEKGARPDGHPVFVQVFLWFWTKAFGVSEIMVRLPFALVSVASIWLAAAMARRWFGDACALMTATVMACAEFPVMYGQLARPYAFGLFFVLAAVFLWTRILFDEERGRKPHVLILYVLASAGAMYTHYFSFFVVVLVGLTGLIFMRRKTWLPYLACSVAAALLFIPHIGITLDQFSKGGVGGPGGWLAKPTPAFFREHLAFIFNQSWIVGIAVILSFGASLFFLIRNKSWNWFQVVALVWFLTPLIVGYLYSTHRNPVLQNSVLLFSMPFLVMLLFSGLRETDNAVGLIVIVFLLIPLCSTIFERNYKLTNYFGRVKDLVVSMNDWSKKYGEKNITFTGNFDGDYFIGYYFDRMDWHPKMASTFNDGSTQLYDFRQLVENCGTDYFSYVWSTRAPSIEQLHLIREKFPYLAERNYYFNSESWLFSKKPGAMKQPNDTVFRAWEHFEGRMRGWKTNEQTLCDSFASTGKHSLRLAQPDRVYGPVYSGKAGELVMSPNDYITVEADVFADSGAAPVAVIEFKRGDSLVKWTGRNFRDVYHDSGSWQKFFYGIRMFKEVQSGDDIRVYFFNDHMEPAYIDNAIIRVIHGSDVIYGKQQGYIW